MYSNKMGGASNPFERMVEGNTASKWENSAQNSASSTKRRRPTLQSRMESQRGPTASSADEFDRSSRKQVSPRNFGRNSHALSFISKTAVQPACWKQKRRTKPYMGTNPTSHTSSPLEQRPSFSSPRRKRRRWISAQKETELWWDTADPINIGFGILSTIKFLYLPMSSSLGRQRRKRRIWR